MHPPPHTARAALGVAAPDPEATNNARCAFVGCEAAATTVAVGCRRGEKQCAQHAMKACIGPWTQCQCFREKRQSKGSKVRDEKALKVGMWIALLSDDEGWVEGEVTHRICYKNSTAPE